MFGPEHPEVAFSLSHLAFYYYQCGDYSQAAHFQDRFLSASESRLGPDHPDLVVHLEYYASLLRLIQRGAEAVPVEARAKAIREKNDKVQHT